MNNGYSYLCPTCDYMVYVWPDRQLPHFCTTEAAKNE